MVEAVTAAALRRADYERSSLRPGDYRLFEEWHYLQRRSDQELTKASFCADHLVADVHRELARLYRDRAERLANSGRDETCHAMAGVGEEAYHAIRQLSD